MIKGKFIAGLDIGTTKICAMVASVKGKRAEVLGVGMAPALGIKKAVVVDMDAATESVREAVRLAKEASGVEINTVHIGIAGGHVECRKSFGATGIRGREISQRDIDRVIESASSVYVPLDREVLHVLPSDFIVDGQDGIVQPIGMSGVKLEANVRVITAAHSAVDNLVRCCERAGLTVMDTVLEPLASARAVVTDEELSEGVLIIDMGGGTTDVALYKDGMLRHASVVPAGGNNFTNDIAIGLRIAHKEAERLKRDFGYVLPQEPSMPERMEVKGMDARVRMMQTAVLAEILRPRCEEIMGMILSDVEREMLTDRPSCVVLTGGSSMLRGAERVAELTFGLPVRYGMPYEGPALALCGMARSPLHSTAVGLLLHGINHERGAYDELFDGISARVNAFKGLFDLRSIKDAVGRKLRANAS